MKFVYERMIMNTIIVFKFQFDLTVLQLLMLFEVQTENLVFQQ